MAKLHIKKGDTVQVMAGESKGAQGVVRKVQTDLGTDTINKAREERIVITPNPSSATPGDDFGFTTNISFFNDGKKFDPSTGSDT